MADEEFHKKRIDKLIEMQRPGEEGGYTLRSEPLETRIKQEGILQRLALPANKLIHYTLVAIHAIVKETSEND